ncbi:thiamine phosphate synthase [Bacillus sp. B15-48]|uniref:thiamine phosphate synthase n=1 Tax=Bacillus sp. B15-48 TaxID=1548601 RepID=UPI00193F5C16|nr:thiamine phosphate synthase [Bacillus sp. B15-48]MBM4764413.1 thiamine phosphate synthase [Bacillus sp. B15-48]
MLICITNRKLCKENFLDRIEKLASGKPAAIMLREKDLSLTDYETLAIQVNEICKKKNVPLIINQNISVAAKLNIPAIQLSMTNLRANQRNLQPFEFIGASVHSQEEALEAQQLGATYLIAGHIFATNSKKGVPPRGLPFLKEICDSVSVPVFAIGGITKERKEMIVKARASGVCIMSEAMTSPSPELLPMWWADFN